MAKRRKIGAAPETVTMICVEKCFARGTAYNFGETITVSRKFFEKELSLGRHKGTGNPMSPLINHFRTNMKAVRRAIKNEIPPKREVLDDMHSDDGLAETSMSVIGTKLRKQFNAGDWKPKEEDSDRPGFNEEEESTDGRYGTDGDEDEDIDDDDPETETKVDGGSDEDQGGDDGETGDGDGDGATTDGPDFSGMSKPALIQACKDKGIKPGARDTMTMLIEKLTA